MANKSVLIGGRTVNVKGRSSFDKSFLNALTSGVGTITPVLKKLVIPSNGRVTMSAHAELPPLATDAYLRSHLKIEAFYTPCRLLTGSWQSWFSGEQVWDYVNSQYARAKLPRGFITEAYRNNDPDSPFFPDSGDVNSLFGASSLSDYFNMKFAYDASGNVVLPDYVGEEVELVASSDSAELRGCWVNLLPYVNYHLLYHHFYRNKSVQRPCFAPTDVATDGDPSNLHAYNLPFVSTLEKSDVILGSKMVIDGSFPLSSSLRPSHPYYCDDILLDDVCLAELRQRNYGDDYFTAARPQAQAGNPVSVQVDANGKFTIASLRLQNAMQEFEEVNNYATPDYVQKRHCSFLPLSQVVSLEKGFIHT